MKKVFLSLVFATLVLSLNAQQKVTIKAGTIVPLLSVKQVKAADVEDGQAVDFRVAQDVKVNDICAIPQGTLVKGKVLEARKSTVGGTKGKLVISINSLTLPDGNPLFFSNSEVRVYGHNRTPVAVVVGLFTLFPDFVTIKS